MGACLRLANIMNRGVEDICEFLASLQDRQRMEPNIMDKTKILGF